MVALKAHEVDRFVEKPDPGFRVILLYGPDGGLVSERADLIARKTGVDLTDPFSTIRLNADEVADDRSRLQDEAFTVGMFGGERLIRISGTTRKNLVEAIKPILTTKLDNVWIIFETGDLNNKSAIRVAFEKAKNAIALPCYQDDDRVLERLVKEELSDHGFSVRNDVIAFLKPFLGGDRMASRNELRKLALYADGEDEITREHILAVVGDASTFDISDVIDAVASGDMVALENNLERVLIEGVSPDILLMNALRHFQLLHEIKGKISANRLPAKTVVDSMRPPIFFQRRSKITACVSRLSLSAIEKIMTRLRVASFEARANPEIGHSIAGTSLLAAVLEARQSR